MASGVVPLAPVAKIYVTGTENARISLVVRQPENHGWSIDTAYGRGTQGNGCAVVIGQVPDV